MNKNILIINTEKCETGWFEYFDELNQKKINFYLLANDPKLLSFFKSKQWPNQSYQKKINPQKNFISLLIFFTLRPIMFFFAFGRLLFFKLTKKINSIACFGFYEKLHFTRAAKLLGLKINWITNPGQQIHSSKIGQNSLSRLSKYAANIFLNKKDANNQKLNLKNIKTIRIGLKNQRPLEQKNIFESLAKNNSINNHKKFFTIGTIQDLNGDVSHIEKLLLATKKCLQVIPQIQLIVAGDGPEKKRLHWMAKKIEINNLVWFVGNHKNPKKWLSSFDLYVSTCPNPKLRDLNITLLASLSSLCVIAPINSGFDEFICNEYNGLLIDTNSSQKLANAIIDLQQNNNKRKKLGENGKKYVIKNFQLNKTIQDLSSVFEK